MKLTVLQKDALLRVYKGENLNNVVQTRILKRLVELELIQFDPPTKNYALDIKGAQYIQDNIDTSKMIQRAVNEVNKKVIHVDFISRRRVS